MEAFAANLATDFSDQITRTNFETVLKYPPWRMKTGKIMYTFT
jgi:hypothetical protein